MTQPTTTVGTRILSMVIDHFALSMIGSLFAIPMMISQFANAFDVSHEPQSIEGLGATFYIALIGLAIYFCKDCIQGRSIGKRIFNLQVVENSTGKVASPIRCFVRNLFCMIWPIELIITSSSPERRLGDMVAGTKVIPYAPENKAEIKIGQIAMTFLLSYIIFFVFTLPYQFLMGDIENKNYQYVESSLNVGLGKEIEQLYADSLSVYLSTEVQAYDEMVNDKRKYISIIFNLKENYLEETETHIDLSSFTTYLLYTKFPEGNFVAQLQYVYQEGGYMQTSRSILDEYSPIDSNNLIRPFSRFTTTEIDTTPTKIIFPSKNE